MKTLEDYPELLKEYSKYPKILEEWSEHPYLLNLFSKYAKITEKLHDKIKPDAIFVTLTSAAGYGWMFKECWKTAWPNEKQPKFFPIKVHAFRRTSERRTEDNFQKYRRKFDKEMERIKKIIKKYNLKRAVIVDEAGVDVEMYDHQFSDNVHYSLDDAFFWEGKNISPRRIIRGFKHGKEDYSCTLDISALVLKEAAEKLGRNIFIRGVTLAATEHRIYWQRQEFEEEEKKGRKGPYYNVKRELEKVEGEKSSGRMIGEIIKERRKKTGKEKLEDILPIILVFGVVGLFVYLLNNINFTGNIIKSLNGSSNLINLILIGVLVLVGYFYLKRLR